MNKLTKHTKMTIQLCMAIALVIIGMILLMCGFWVDPTGEIHSSVLTAFGECCTFAGCLLGIDYTYKYKMSKIEKDDE